MLQLEVKDVKVKELAKGNATLEVTFSEEMANANLGTVTVKKAKKLQQLQFLLMLKIKQKRLLK